MKKFLLSIGAMVLFALSGFAQPSHWVGGNVGFSSSKVDSTQSNFKMVIGPSLGLMISEKGGVGLDFAYSIDNTDFSDSEDYRKSNMWTVSPYFRYYFAGNEKLHFYGDLYAMFGGGKTETKIGALDPIETKNSMLGFGVRPGVQFWFTENWSIASSLGILSYDSKTSDKGGNKESTSSQFNFAGDFSSFKLSFFYHF